MRLPVGHIVKLIGPDRAIGRGFRQLSRQTFGIVHIVVGVFVRCRRHLDQISPGEPQHVLLFLALRLGDHNDGFEPHRRADQGQPDPSITCRALDNRATRFQVATRDRIADDIERRAVFHRLARVHELGLTQNLATCLIAELVETDQRGIADCLGQILMDGHLLRAPRLVE